MTKLGVSIDDGDESFGDDDGLPPLEEVESVVKDVPFIESDATLRSRMLHSLGLMLTKESKVALVSLPFFVFEALHFFCACAFENEASALVDAPDFGAFDFEAHCCLSESHFKK